MVTCWKTFIFAFILFSSCTLKHSLGLPDLIDHYGALWGHAMLWRNVRIMKFMKDYFKMLLK